MDLISIAIGSATVIASIGKPIIATSTSIRLTPNSHETHIASSITARPIKRPHIRARILCSRKAA
ncbi:hypothetical protein [Bradyrhizobium sp. STM 3809]|uniref:hypothetical protein n=1 Tax=Bradyrhizobium sp. STM 3809 TaxID=551936 RepID=UPI001478398C|nr:hypothetical protein [Bradyrhizobium sp. STM 3809]